MRTVFRIMRALVVTVMALTNFVASSLAQEVSIPDPGLNAAIREALQKPSGPLSEQDLLSLTNLDACCRNIGSLEGLGSAYNLSLLSLQSNSLANVSVPSELSNLTTIDLSFNPLTNCFFPDGLTNLDRIIIKTAHLTNLTLPADLMVLIELDLEDNQFTSINLPSNLIGLGALNLSANQLDSFTLPANLTEMDNLGLESNRLTSFSLPSNLTRLFFLDLSFNLLTNCALPSGLADLDTLVIAGNQLTNLSLPEGLTRLTGLDLSDNQLTSFALPADLTNLLSLNLFFNQLTNLTMSADPSRLTELDLDFNRFTTLNLPPNLTHLSELHVRSNRLSTFNLPADMTALSYLDLGENQLSNITLPAGLNHLNLLRLSGNKQLTSFILPPGLTSLSGLYLRSNQLTNLTLPSDLFQLASLDVLANQLASLTLPAGLTNLVDLFLSGNQLTNLTLPPDMTQLNSLVLDGNPLATLVLSEPLAAANLAGTIESLRNQGVSVFTYPLAVQLIRPLALVGAFKFGVTGPPGVYAILGSADLAAWNVVGIATNPLGSVNFVDVTAHSSPQKFYRARLQGPPTNMVFIPPNTFTMGSPTNEQDRNIFEGPQTTVTLSRGFWIGKYEVTQGEYLSIMNTNPSDFPGDLSRPASSVSWFDATNYCWKLTQRELAAGRIPAGSEYRLPTEAEWECAARAGTTTRFSYGDDPGYASLTNHAWFFLNSDLTVHPVGQKLPNPRGLYDMAGNVWEWCQDWYADQTGGVQTDPTGPASNPNGNKVMRGGAYDYDNSSCRSASRLFRFPSWPDSDLGFRVVLVTEPQ